MISVRLGRRVLADCTRCRLLHLLRQHPPQLQVDLLRQHGRLHLPEARQVGDRRRLLEHQVK